jgi:hypothetical protein
MILARRCHVCHRSSLIEPWSEVKLAFLLTEASPTPRTVPDRKHMFSVQGQEGAGESRHCKMSGWDLGHCWCCREKPGEGMWDGVGWLIVSKWLHLKVVRNEVDWARCSPARKALKTNLKNLHQMEALSLDKIKVLWLTNTLSNALYYVQFLTYRL